MKTEKSRVLCSREVAKRLRFHSFVGQHWVKEGTIVAFWEKIRLLITFFADCLDDLRSHQQACLVGRVKDVSGETDLQKQGER